MRTSENDMKIAILVPFFLPRYKGGVEIATYNIARNLQTRGNQVHVITSGGHGMAKVDYYEGVTVHRVYWPKIGMLGMALLEFNMLIAARRVDPEIIHFQSLETSACGPVAKRLLKKPYVVSGHGSDVYRDAEHSSKLYNRFVREILRISIRDAAAVTALTEDMSEQIKQDYAKEAIIIPNGLNPEWFQRVSQNRARKKLQLRDDEKILISISNLRAVKGLEYLICALQLLQAKKLKVRLLVIGEGPEEAKLKTLAEELGLKANVIFVGSIANELVPDYLAASDVFVLPSLSEGFPVVSLEAMAAGLPIIATRVRGIPSIVTEGVNGFLVKPRDASEIADRVLLILGDAELRQTISENNSRKARRFDWNKIVGDLEKVYLSCLKAT